MQVVDEEDAQELPSDSEMRLTMTNLEGMLTNSVSLLVKTGDQE
jgi:hypothetical protein